MAGMTTGWYYYEEDDQPHTLDEQGVEWTMDADGRWYRWKILGNPADGSRQLIFRSDEPVNIVAYKPRTVAIDYLPLMSTGVHWKYEQAARRIKPGNAIYDFLVEHNLFDDLDDFPVE